MTTVYLLSILPQTTTEGRRELPARLPSYPCPRQPVQRMENARRPEKTGSVAAEPCGKRLKTRENDEQVKSGVGVSYCPDLSSQEAAEIPSTRGKREQTGRHEP
jgi:hypothetical protein